MRTSSNDRLSATGYLLVAISYLLISGCTHAIPRFGTGGRYQEGRDEVTRRRGGNIDQAILSLEAVVRDNPTYRDSLTLLARAYYKKERYQDAFQIVQRALVVNREDEIAWLVLGLTQLRLGMNQQGLESIKGGLTLLSKAMRDGYGGFPQWDLNGFVRSALRRSVLQVTKGLDEKENLIQAVERLLTTIDEEEWYQRGDRAVERGQEQGR